MPAQPVSKGGGAKPASKGDGVQLAVANPTTNQQRSKDRLLAEDTEVKRTKRKENSNAAR